MPEAWNVGRNLSSGRISRPIRDEICQFNGLLPTYNPLRDLEIKLNSH
jgi:hypothetical protein